MVPLQRAPSVPPVVWLTSCNALSEGCWTERRLVAFCVLCGCLSVFLFVYLSPLCLVIFPLLPLGCAWYPPVLLAPTNLVSLKHSSVWPCRLGSAFFRLVSFCTWLAKFVPSQHSCPQPHLQLWPRPSAGGEGGPACLPSVAARHLLLRVGGAAGVEFGAEAKKGAEWLPLTGPLLTELRTAPDFVCFEPSFAFSLTKEHPKKYTSLHDY